MKVSLAVAASVLVLGCSCDLLRSVRPGAGQKIVIVYTGTLNWNLLPEMCALARDESADLTLVAGGLSVGWPVAALYDGRAEAEALSASGVSAVGISPGMLRQGIRRLRTLIDSMAPGVMFLSANLLDSTTRSAIGQGFLKARATARGPVERLGLIAVTPDSADQSLKQPGLLWQSPEEASRRLMPSLRLGSDLTGIVYAAGSETELSGFDFVIGGRKSRTPLPDRDDIACRLELKVDGRRRIVSQRVREIRLSTIEPDPEVKAIVNRYAAAADSLAALRINDSDVELTPRALARIMTRVAPMVLRADGSLFGNSLRLASLPPGPVTLQALHRCAGANELVVVRIKGQEAGLLSGPGEPGIQWRGALRRQPIPLARQFDIVTTVDYVRTHERLRGRPLQFVPVTAAQVLAWALRDRTADSIPEIPETMPPEPGTPGTGPESGSGASPSGPLREPGSEPRVPEE